MSVRLLAALTDQWETFDGYAVSNGVPDLRELDLGRLCNFIYWYLTKDGDHQGIQKFRAKLWQPPKGVVPDSRSPWSPENETAALKAFAASMGATPKSSRA